MAKKPTRYESSDGMVSIKLDMLPGDLSMVAMASPPDETKGIGVFLYSDGSVSILGFQPKMESIALMKKCIETLAIVPDQEIPS